MLRVNKRYFFLFAALLIIVVLIALFVHDAFIRPYVGDFLVVILIYCLLRAFLKVSVLTAALFVFVFSCAVETAQYFNLARWLGLAQNRVATIIIGNSFEWLDILAYFLAILFIIFIEHKSTPLQGHT